MNTKTCLKQATRILSILPTSSPGVPSLQPQKTAMDANRQRPWRLRCAALASLVSAFVLPAFVLPSQCAPHTTKSPRQDARVTMYIVTPGPDSDCVPVLFQIYIFLLKMPYFFLGVERVRKSIKVWPSEQPRLRRSIARIEGQNQAWTAQIPYAHWWSQCHQNFRPHGTSGVLHRRYQARKSKFLWNIHLLGTRSHHGNISSTFCLR